MGRTTGSVQQPHWAEELARGLVNDRARERDEQARREADERALIELAAAQGPGFLDRLAGALQDGADYFNKILDRSALQILRTDEMGDTKATGVVLRGDGDWLVAVYPSWRPDDPSPGLRINQRDGSRLAQFQASEDGKELQVIFGGEWLSAERFAEAVVRGARLTELVR